MNVLILTPDAVGSTLLQRLITIYMQFHQYDLPVINLHELTNGLIKYHNNHFNQEVLGKKPDKYGYYQSLEQIVNLLISVNHYKTSRLAHYHIKNRKDDISDQIPFYQYLNDNFYIISCRRHNLFEHALSWCLSKVTKKLNVYSGAEKINSFFDIYKDGIDLDPNSLLQTLNAYKEYVVWCNNHFNVANYFYYEEHLPCIEKYILNLPIFSQQTQLLTWKDNFDISFDQWNLCHYVASDVGSLALDDPQGFAKLAAQTKTLKISMSESTLLSNYNNIRDDSWPQISSIKEYENLPQHIRNEVEQKQGSVKQNNTNLVAHKELPRPLIEFLPAEHQKFFQNHKKSYGKTNSFIDQMIEKGVIIGNPPIKKQTLSEKKHMIRNYQHLLNVFNQWIEMNPDLGRQLDNETLDQCASVERNNWKPKTTAIAKS